MRKKLLIGIIVLILFSSGCIKKPGIGPEVTEYNIGTKGLEINIIKNLPPEETWKGNAFVIGIELINAGAFNITDGELALSGFDPEYIGIQKPQETFELNGKQPGYPDGESKVFNFEVQNLGIREGSEEYVSSFSIRTEYNYETTATAEVCINPDIYSTVKTKHVCEIGPITLRGGQGAPVSVVSIDETISPVGLNHEVSFIFHIKNQGEGRVMNKFIKVKEAKLSNQELECKDNIEFENKEDNLIQCSVILEELRGAYITPLSITFEYEYENVVDHKLKIVDLLLKSKKI